MRAPSRGTGSRSNDELAMTSMIDVVFLLLVFFVWTSSFDRPETNLPGRIAMVTPPQDSASSKRPRETDTAAHVRTPELIVQVLQTTEGVAYRVGAIDLPDITAVEAKLTRISGLAVSPLVIVDPEKAVSVADSIRVFDLARRLGFNQVLLAVDNPG